MEELLLALLGEFLETCDHIGLSYYEERARAWIELLGIQKDQEQVLRAIWEQRIKDLQAIDNYKWRTNA